MGDPAEHLAAPGQDEETQQRREWLGQLRLSVEDGSIWATPRIREQLREDIERLGLTLP
jgi:hypothetical protein